ncbi:DUF1833 family protein [Bordetella genomosp. 9]|uniref:DUF1833 domain-containing protein n=1 Tax=Bordetella genomosp. 9 TaxID=1416803 RepID=A0A1W6YYX3_9BORD|nr:DUF1833 family protein [Bordetella genomosp. 9]ARP86302.1 hypothetical protein CAL13_08895 [Bordetella genomosp. 9]
MSRQFSANGRRQLLATSADENLLVCLEISHPDLSIPIRVVRDTQDLVARGNVYTACPFDITLPDDIEGQIPQATIQVDNVGRELTEWLEYSRGGQGAKCRIITLFRSDPDVFETDMTLDLTGMKIDNLKVSGNLGFINTLGQVAVVKTFTPKTAPGLW